MRILEKQGSGLSANFIKPDGTPVSVTIHPNVLAQTREHYEARGFTFAGTEYRWRPVPEVEAAHPAPGMRWRDTVTGDIEMVNADGSLTLIPAPPKPDETENAGAGR